MVLIEKGAAHNFAAAVFRCRVERIVYRGEQDNPVARLAESPHCHEKGGNHAAGADDFLRLYLPVVLLLHPLAHSFQIFLGRPGVAQDVGVHVSLQALGDFRGVFKLHIRHREGHHAFLGVRILFPHSLPFARAMFGAVDKRFKIILHNNNTSKKYRYASGFAGNRQKYYALFCEVCQ